MFEALKDCTCKTCRREEAKFRPPWDQTQYQVIPCPICGRDRCPHAYSHADACTGSKAVS
jgi:hypothetical protein